MFTVDYVRRELPQLGKHLKKSVTSVSLTGLFPGPFLFIDFSKHHPPTLLPPQARVEQSTPQPTHPVPFLYVCMWPPVPLVGTVLYFPHTDTTGFGRHASLVPQPTPATALLSPSPHHPSLLLSCSPQAPFGPHGGKHAVSVSDPGLMG